MRAWIDRFIPANALSIKTTRSSTYIQKEKTDKAREFKDQRLLDIRRWTVFILGLTVMMHGRNSVTHGTEIPPII